MNITLMRTEDGEVLLQGTYSTLRRRRTGGRCYYTYSIQYVGPED